MATKIVHHAAPAASKPAVQPTGISASHLQGLNAVFIKPEYTPARLPAGTVLAIQGQAIVRTPEGELHQLQIGEVLQKGDMLLTSQNGYVQIEAPGTRMVNLPFESGIVALPEIDQALAEMSMLDAAPAAGGYGDPGNLTPGTQVERVIEIVAPSEYAFDPANLATGPIVVLSNQPPAPLSVTVGVSPHDISIGPGSTYAEDLEPRMQFVVSLVGTSNTNSTVTLAVTGGPGVNLGATGTALNPPDFKANVNSNLQVSTDGGQTWIPISNGQATIPAGHTELLVQTPAINNDAVYEGPEQVTLTATLITPVNTSTAAATATITDASDLPTVSSIVSGIPNNPNPTNTDFNTIAGTGSAWNWDAAGAAHSIKEGNPGNPTNYLYTKISLSTIAAAPYTLHVTSQDGTATLGQDYGSLQYWNGSQWQPFTASGTGTSADISVSPGTADILVRSIIIGDKLVEPNETFTLNASTDTSPTPVSTTITIIDDDSLLHVNADAVSVQEVGATTFPAASNTLPSNTVSGNVILGDNTGTGKDFYTDLNGAPLSAVPAISGVIAGTSSNPVSGGVGQTIIGQYGSLLLNADGSYTYTVDNTKAAPLANGETALDVFTYTIQDTNNTDKSANATPAPSTTLTITVVGTNEAPVAHADQSQGVVEAGTNLDGTPFAGTPNVSGNVILGTGDPRGTSTGADTDIDHNDVLTVKNVSGAGGSAPVNSGTGTYGTLVLNADGSYNYTLDNTNSATNALAAGQQVQDVFTYTIADKAGATASTTLSINITGSNDAPVARADISQPLIEAGVDANGNVIAGISAASGNVITGAGDPRGTTAGADTDVDSPTLTVTGVAAGTQSSATGTVGAAIAGTYGSLVLNSNGIYNYTLDNNLPATNALKAGQQAQDVFTYTITDDHGASATTTLTVNITGTNDAPVLNASGSALSTTVYESGLPSGTLAGFTATTTTNQIIVTDPEGSPITFKFSSTPATVLSYYDTTSHTVQNATWNLSTDGKTLHAQNASGVDLLIITVDDTGKYTTTLYGALQHPNDPTNPNNTLAVPVTILASDGTTSTTVPVNITVVDDAPIAGHVGADGGYIDHITLNQNFNITIGNNHGIQGVDVTYTYNPGTNSVAAVFTDPAFANSLGLTDPTLIQSISPSNPAGIYQFNSTTGKLELISSSGATYIFDINHPDNPAVISTSHYVNEFVPYTVKDYDGDLLPISDLQNPGGGSTFVTYIGSDGNDVITGDPSRQPPTGPQVPYDSVMMGGGGNDTLSGGLGQDTIYGGPGNDLMTGDLAGATNQFSDTFAWALGDAGKVGTPANDTITDFNVSAPASGGDVLNLKDLLIGEHDGTVTGVTNNLSQYLQVTTAASTTTIHVSSTGQFNGSNTATAEDQTIVLQNVDLHSLSGLTAGSTSDQIIQALINQQKLVVDH